MKLELVVGAESYFTNEWIMAKYATNGAYIGSEQINRSNMHWLQGVETYQDVNWVDLRKEVVPGEGPDVTRWYFEPVAPDAIPITTDAVFVNDPLDGRKICYLKSAVYDTYQAVWDGDGILDQIALESDLQAAYQGAWPNHDAALAEYLYGDVLAKSLTMTNAQRYAAYNDALLTLGLDVDYGYDPPRGPIASAVHQYGLNIMAF